MNGRMIFYVDMYFILNFILNLFFALMTAMLRQKRWRLLRFLSMALLMAAFSSLIIVWIRSFAAILELCRLIFFCPAFFGRCSKRDWCKDTGTLLGISFFTGGTLLGIRSLLEQFRFKQFGHSFFLTHSVTNLSKFWGSLRYLYGYLCIHFSMIP